MYNLNLVGSEFKIKLKAVGPVLNLKIISCLFKLGVECFQKKKTGGRIVSQKNKLGVESILMF